MFDEQYSTYPSINFLRADGHPRGELPHSVAEAGGGSWSAIASTSAGGSAKEVGAGRVVVTMGLATTLGTDEHEAIAEVVAGVGAFTGRTVAVDRQSPAE